MAKEALDTPAQEVTEEQEVARMVAEGCPDFLPPEPDTTQEAQEPAEQAHTPGAVSVFQRLRVRHGLGARVVAQRQQADSFPSSQIFGD